MEERAEVNVDARLDVKPFPEGFITDNALEICLKEKAKNKLKFIIFVITAGFGLAGYVKPVKGKRCGEHEHRGN